MIVYFGLNKEIGNVSYYDSTGQQEYAFNKPYSESTAQTIDIEVKKIIEEAYARAKRILLENKDKLEQLADILLKKEVIFREDLEHIFGKRAFEDVHEAIPLSTDNEEASALPSAEVKESLSLNDQPPSSSETSLLNSDEK